MVSLSRFDNLWSATMRVEVLYFDGCPTYRVAEKTLRGVLAQEDVEAEVELVAVNSDEEVQRLRFPGSPTIRVDGEDLFPVPERAGYALGCRMYATPEGLRGSPTTEMVRASLAERNLVRTARPGSRPNAKRWRGSTSVWSAGSGAQRQRRLPYPHIYDELQRTP
jgi:hypothetical protein